MTVIIGIRFRKSGKVYYFDPDNLQCKKGDHAIVETARGVEYGTIVLPPKEVEDDKIVQPLKKVIRLATPEDDKTCQENLELEKEAFQICKQKIQERNLEMKLIDSEYTFDRNKLLFYFTADGRIDFRELVKDLAAVFRTRIELRQIGVRDETKLLGGISICGRPLCCHTYLSDFAPVSIKMAKEQNLSLNPSKISGACGRLMCCLKNEEEAYKYLNKNLPHIGAKVSTDDGYTGEVLQVSVLKQKVKVVVTKENDEKDIREYPVSELQFENQYRHKADENSSLTLPSEELDESELKELEQLENEDLEPSNTEEVSVKPQPQPRSEKKPYNGRQRKPYGKRTGEYDTEKRTRDFSEKKQKDFSEKKPYKNNRGGKNTNQHNSNPHNKTPHNKNYKNHKTH
ncbi:MAG: stage 0 sporulation family protein [Butyribacter sp.]|nr:stage 0 sporulation family protein [bacterium]MDY3854684.1 stage 0 sporulation family protein [Butyribacter sp.]